MGESRCGRLGQIQPASQGQGTRPASHHRIDRQLRRASGELRTASRDRLTTAGSARAKCRDNLRSGSQFAIQLPWEAV